VFAAEVALARLLQHFGITPTALIGHSVGEFAAAVMAGVFTLEEAAKLVATRGKLMWEMPRGKMLAVMKPAEELQGTLPEGVNIAAVNSPAATVVSGSAEAIEKYAAALAADDIKATELATSHGFHSHMMAGAKAPLEEQVAAISGRSAEIDIFSTATGTQLSAGQLADGAYWGSQLMQPVLFKEAALAAAAANPRRIFVEVGPGQALSAFARQILVQTKEAKVLSAMGPARNPGSDLENALSLVGALWVNGITPDWHQVTHGGGTRVALPTYPFERKSFWVEPATATNAPAAAPAQTQAQPVAPSDDAMIDDVERLIHQQIQLVSQQLKAMQGK
jgi:acyl transferase domain-containing protein